MSKLIISRKWQKKSGNHVLKTNNLSTRAQTASQVLMVAHSVSSSQSMFLIWHQLLIHTLTPPQDASKKLTLPLNQFRKLNLTLMLQHLVSAIWPVKKLSSLLILKFSTLKFLCSTLNILFSLKCLTLLLKPMSISVAWKCLNSVTAWSKKWNLFGLLSRHLLVDLQLTQIYLLLVHMCPHIWKELTLISWVKLWVTS